MKKIKFIIDDDYIDTIISFCNNNPEKAKYIDSDENLNVKHESYIITIAINDISTLFLIGVECGKKFEKVRIIDKISESLGGAYVQIY